MSTQYEETRSLHKACIYVPSKACINSYIRNVAISSCIKAGAKQMVFTQASDEMKMSEGFAE